MKKICILLNSLVDSNGVSRSAVAVANLLTSRNNVEITLVPIYKCSKETVTRLNNKIIVKNIFGFYFNGFSFLSNIIPLGFYIWLLSLKKYDILIAFQYGLSTRIVGAIPNSSDSTRIAWMHGYDNGLRLRSDYEKIGHVVCVSKYNAAKLKKEIPDIEVDFNYNPIDDEQVRMSGLEEIELKRPSCPLFISVGRHSKEKGFMRLLEIVSRLKTEGYMFNLWLVGDGPQHQELMSYSSNKGLNDIVIFLGAKGNPHAYTSKADVFICSSYTEGYSTACTEAIMLGVPVITTNVSGGEEIITDSGCGILTGIDDDSLYNGMKVVLDQPHIINEWKNILNTTKNNFSQRNRSDHLFKILGI